MKVAVFRKERFNAAHRLFNPNWSEEKNKEVFGLCSNPNYHGHNYTIEVKVVGRIDPETGYVIDIKVLKAIIQSEIIEAFDHKNLNLDVKDFKDVIPTAEQIAIISYRRIKAKLIPELELKIRLYETERNFVEYPA